MYISFLPGKVSDFTHPTFLLLSLLILKEEYFKMQFITSVIIAVAFACPVTYGIPMNPRDISNSQEPIPSESSYYNDYRGVAPPFPANHTDPILPNSRDHPSPDDYIFQNLLAAEWAIFNFYQQAVEAFNTSSFTDMGLPNTTYDRIQEIRDNEAGHMRIFQDTISASSIKPGSCKYDYGWSNASEWLSLQVLIEVSSMVFASSLVQQAKLNPSKGAIVGIGETETRHALWALIDVWGEDPFGGPIDTPYPYANQILDSTNKFIIPGSCPSVNPVYPSPRQNIPQIFSEGIGTPGTVITF
jgi:hypothetical protein